MKHSILTALTAAWLLLAVTAAANAQNAILAEMYGKGVHAFYAGKYLDARQYLSMAIDNGTDDPRAYYFRGLVAYRQGSTYEAESDWQRGAELEARGKTNPFVGRSLTRFQGAGRLKLEEIRQRARLQAAALRAARSNQRLGEIESSGIVSPVPRPPVPARPDVAAPAAPPAPPAADDDPFADDMAEGEPRVTADDALEGATDDPFAAAEPAPAAAGGEEPTPADTADPFGGGQPAADDDPFAGGDDGADPFAP